MQKKNLTLIRVMALVSAGIIVLMPFHAFLTVWGSTAFGHYTLLRLWKEVLLLGLMLAGIATLITQQKDRRSFFGDNLFRLICVYGLVLLAAGGVALALHGVSKKAFGYGLLVDGRYLAFFCVTWLVTLHDDILVRWWKRLLLIPAAVAVGFAALQFTVLPADFLRHFGYGPKTILPTETVDQKAAYRRVTSTLRGANPFGAYLVVIISAIGAWLLKGRRRWLAAIFFVFSLAALFFTMSRSAWIGTAAALIVLAGVSVSTQRARRLFIFAATAAVLAFGGLTLALRHNDRFENLFFHTSSTSRSSESSNAQHASALKKGLKDIAREPWGSGTGTAGPQSVYNDHPARIAENYYVQVAQETGLEGLALFLGINIIVAFRLWQRRNNQLALVLLVSFVGLAAVNMLLHAWADDTLAYVWWGLAGAAMALPLRQKDARAAD